MDSGFSASGSGRCCGGFRVAGGADGAAASAAVAEIVEEAVPPGIKEEKKLIREGLFESFDFSAFRFLAFRAEKVRIQKVLACMENDNLPNTILPFSRPSTWTCAPI